MQQKLLFYMLLLILIPGVIFAQSGKLRGTVIDQKTKEPLIGANIVVDGTNLGAATDVDGTYIILNVPVGTYSLKASYIGYSALTISNVRINANLTTEIKLELYSEDVKVQTVEVIADRPLINKSATGAVRVIDKDFIENLPSRGINTVITMQPGVVELNGNIYVRGGRPDETGYSIEGVSITNLYAGGRGVGITGESIEQVQVLTGGYTAEYGNATSGIVQTEIRSGGDALKASLLVESDKYANIGNKSLGGYSYGYRDITATIGGPIGKSNLRFFGSIQSTHYDDQNFQFYDGYNFRNITMFPALTPAHPNDAISDTKDLIVHPGSQLGGGSDRLAFMGKMNYSINKIQLNASGSYSHQTSRGQTSTSDIFNLSRLPKYTANDGFLNVKASTNLTPNTYVEVSLDYSYRFDETADPDWGDNLLAYGDSALNASKGYIYPQDGQNFKAYTIMLGSKGIGELPSFDMPGTLIVGGDANAANPIGYLKRDQKGFGGHINLISQINKSVELRVGGEYTTYIFEQINPAGLMHWAADFKNLSGADLEKKLLGYGQNNVGFDVYGNGVSENKIDNGAMVALAPRKPVFAASYVQSKIELQDIILNLGLRMDYISADGIDWVNRRFLTFNDSLGAINASNFKVTPGHTYVSPRIGFSFPVTDQTVFYTQFGRFIQQPRMQESYRGPGFMYNIIKGGFFYTNPVGFGIKPEQTTMYEIGFKQQVSDNAAFDVAAFYKDIHDQVTFESVIPMGGAPQQSYYAFTNGDFATTKGLEFNFTLRRTKRIQASLNYTLSDARGTSSTPSSNAGAWGSATAAGPVIPLYVVPLNFNQMHRGSILIDYRYGKNDGGKILEQMGLNVLMTFNSGSNYTHLDIPSQANVNDPRFRSPLEEIGASVGPWDFRVDLRLDKTFQVGRLSLNAYIYVVNIFNTENALFVYPRTGDPKDDGWLSTANGRDQITKLGSEGALYQQLYQAFNEGVNGGIENNVTGNFAAPRQIRFGIKLEY